MKTIANRAYEISDATGSDSLPQRAERVLRELVEEIAVYVHDGGENGQPGIWSTVTLAIALRRRFLGPPSAEEVAWTTMFENRMSLTWRELSDLMVKALRETGRLKEEA